MKTDNTIAGTEVAPSEKNNLEELLEALLAQKVAQAENEREGDIYRSAAQEAGRLARITEYPALVFPVLFEEKTNAGQGRLSPPGTPCVSRYDLVTV